MRKTLKQMMTVVAAVCLTCEILLCFIGCSDGKSGTQYKYEAGSFTDTYDLFDDGTYKRIYDGSDYSNMTLETGTYESSSSSVSFKAENVSDYWPGGVSKYYWLLNPYHGTLTDSSLYISGRTYKEHGSVWSSK